MPRLAPLQAPYTGASSAGPAAVLVSFLVGREIDRPYHFLVLLPALEKTESQKTFAGLLKRTIYEVHPIFESPYPLPFSMYSLRCLAHASAKRRKKLAFSGGDTIIAAGYRFERSWGAWLGQEDMKLRFPFPVLLICLLMVGCSQTSPAPAPPPIKPYVVPSEFTIDAHAERGAEGEIYILGSSNFPDGLKMWVHVESGKLPLGAPKVVAGDEDVIVQSGHFRTVKLLAESRNPKFTHEMESWPDAKKLKYVNSPFPSGNYKVRFLSYFNGAWQTRAVLAALGGDGGKSLHGKILRPKDADVIDSDMILDTVYTIDFPGISRDAEAIHLVKTAILTVPERGRSATNIESNIELFMSMPGISKGTGWSATLKTGTIYEVDYDFINGTQGEKKAIWSADLSTKTVKYVNESAKLFSWTPNY